jgi:ribose 5-phosphate isomerase B
LNIAFATDHAAFETRGEIIKFIESLGHTVTDYGYDKPDSCDYPDFAYKACSSVVEGKNERAVLLCGTGIGISIAANKVFGIRAGVVWSEETAKLAAQHNNANALCLGVRTASVKEICAYIKIWLQTPFEQRHQKRIDKISNIESMQCKK